MIILPLGLALGVFCGNFVIYGILQHNVKKGLFIGGLAGIVSFILLSLFNWLF